MGPEISEFVKQVFDSDDVLYQLRAVQAIVMHLEKFPIARARAACARASFYGNFTYRGVKAILTQALDLEPLPTPMISTKDSTPNFRFARNVADLVNARIEETHEPH